MTSIAYNMLAGTSASNARFSGLQVISNSVAAVLVSGQRQVIQPRRIAAIIARTATVSPITPRLGRWPRARSLIR